MHSSGHGRLTASGSSAAEQSLSSAAKFQRLGLHKTGPKKKVPAGVHTEDPHVMEHCVVLDNPQPHNPHPVKVGVGYGEA